MSAGPFETSSGRLLGNAGLLHRRGADLVQLGAVVLLAEPLAAAAPAARDRECDHVSPIAAVPHHSCLHVPSAAAYYDPGDGHLARNRQPARGAGVRRSGAPGRRRASRSSTPGRLSGSAKNREQAAVAVSAGRRTTAVRGQARAEQSTSPTTCSGARSWSRSSGGAASTPAAPRRTCCSPPGTTGVGSCPNGLRDPEAAREALGLGRRARSSRSCSPSATRRGSAILPGGRRRSGAPARTASRSTSSSPGTDPESGPDHAGRQSLDQAAQDTARARACRSARRPSSGRAPLPPPPAAGRCRSPAARSPSSTMRSIPAKSRAEPIVVPWIDCQFEVDRPHVERHLRPSRSAEHDQPAAACAAPAASRATSSRPSRARGRRGRPPRPSRPRCRARRPPRPSSFARSIFSSRRRRDEHSRARLCGQLDGERGHAAARAEHEHGLVAVQPPDREQGPPGRQRRERKRSRLLPREALRLGEDVLGRHLRQLRVRAVVRAAEDAPVGPGGILAVAPVRAPGRSRPPRRCHAGCRRRPSRGSPAARNWYAGPGGFRTSRSRRLTAAAFSSTTTSPGPATGSVDAPRTRARRLREPRTRLHRNDPQGSSLETSTATYPPSPTAGASTTCSSAGSEKSLYEPCTTSLSM